MNLYAIIGAVIMSIVFTGGVFRLGMKYASGQQAEAKVKEVEKIVYRDRIIEKEVPKIVTKVVEKRVEVEKEVERVVKVAPDFLDPDCVMPRNFGMLLASAANGIDPRTAAGGVNTFSGDYRCAEVLEAVLADYEAGVKNTAQLNALLEWHQVVAKAEQDAR